MAEKTNVMRVLDSRKIAYQFFFYDADPTLTGSQIAGILGENVECVFKTLVARGKTGKIYVFMVPVAEELDLKKAAFAANEKFMEMLKAKELLPLTGYVHGGCSPVGMKKHYKTFAHKTAADFPEIYFSAGKVGAQVKAAFTDLQKCVDISLADIIKDK